MSNWFYAANGQQQGPFGEAQLRDLIANGTVRADTLVWTEGMAGWQKAAEVPGLMASAGGPPVLPMGGSPPMMGAGGGPGHALSADLPLWGLLGRSLVYIIGMAFVIPAPWVAVWFYRWFASRLQVPGRPNFSFTGQVGDIWWAFILLVLLGLVGAYDPTYQLIAIILQAVLSWVVLRWAVSNLASNGQKIPTAFNGSIWGYIGWQLLLILSFITIIGWAWVITAMLRWICRNISGTRREILFNASGWQVLWRSIVFALLCLLIIPIPWMLRWYGQWYVSQFALAPRGSAHA
jgi:cobalamin synthase